MGLSQGIPRGAAIAISDMLDVCAEIKPGQEVLILAQIDGLYGGDNMVDREAISWIQEAISFRGANPSVFWIDEQAKPHAWRFPPVVKAAAGACDIFINHSFDLVHEEIVELKNFLWEPNRPIMVRNFATTSSLLCTSWAQTPYELVSEIRYQASLPFLGGVSWQLTDPNGTCLEGKIEPAKNRASKRIAQPDVPSYSQKREEYRPWPEWLHRPVGLSDTNGIFIFDRMLSWWSRYIGISPFFQKAIKLYVENNRITRIEGGDEAEALKRFLDFMRGKLGDGVYQIRDFHFGVHPQAIVGEQQCPNILHRRLIEHSHSSNLHVHIGAPPSTAEYPYYMHCTGDTRNSTLRVGGTLVHDKGHLMALESSEVRAVAAKYPGRPGLEPVPRSF